MAYRWFCRWGLEATSTIITFSKNRQRPLRESYLLRKLLRPWWGVHDGRDRVRRACAVDAGYRADAHRRRGRRQDRGPRSDLQGGSAEYCRLAEAAVRWRERRAEDRFRRRSGRPLHRFGPLSRPVMLFRQLPHRLKHAVIMDVEATTTIRQVKGRARRCRRTDEQVDHSVAPRSPMEVRSAEMVGLDSGRRGIEPT